MPIELLDRQTLEEYLNSLDKIKYTTHNRHQAVLTALFNFAVSTGYIKSNPIERLPLRKASPSKGEHRTDEVIRYLTPSQLETLYCQVSNHPRLNALVSLLHRTGARISELLALFREAKVADAASLTEWLAAQVLAYDLKIASLLTAAYQRLRMLKIEPPTSERLERITRSARRTFEERFCATTVLSLSPATIERLDALLKPEVSDTDTQAGIEQSSSTLTTLLAVLKADPGRIGLDSLQKEVAKLQLRYCKSAY